MKGGYAPSFTEWCSIKMEKSIRLRNPISYINAYKATAIAFAVVMLFVVLGTNAFATDTGNVIVQGVSTLARNVYNIFTGVVGVIAIVYLAANAFNLFLGDKNAVQAVKTALLRGIMGLGIVMFAPAIIVQILSWIPQAAWPV